jgi:uncharacterized repeat protein (TIGR03803 family)
MEMERRTGLLAIAVLLLLKPAVAEAATYRILYDFDGSYGVGGPNGGPPLAAPVLAPNGDLYGPAGGGIGNSDRCNGPCGVVFRLTRGAGGAWHESVALNVSTYFDLAPPNSPLTFDARGNLYGSLQGGIGRNWIFQMAPHPNGWGFNVIYQDYGDAVGGVVADGAGNLYGSLGPGNDYSGAIARLSPGSGQWRYTDLRNLCNAKGACPGGADPRAPFSWDAAGNLYGTDYLGGRTCNGSSGCGVAFRMTPNADGSWRYQVLHRFGASKRDGVAPLGGLVVDRSGNAYGTTTAGGPHGLGSVFELSPTSRGAWNETLLYGFPNITLGAAPWGNLVFDAAGNLYGVANGGDVCGIYYCGEVFELMPQRNGRWKYSVLHDFTGPDGEYPYGVVIDNRGRLFGTTLGGGAHGYGVVFEVATPVRGAEGVTRPAASLSRGAAG